MSEEVNEATVPAEETGGSDAVTYATVADVQARMTRDLSADEEAVCGTLLEDAAVLIDTVAPNASAAAKKTVSCRMVLRNLGSGEVSVPMGATQGSQSALGYSQSWTISSGGAAGELYLNRTDRRLLGLGDKIGAYSPTAELVTAEEATAT